jgi:hypothetical protein
MNNQLNDFLNTAHLCSTYSITNYPEVISYFDDKVSIDLKFTYFTL